MRILGGGDRKLEERGERSVEATWTICRPLARRVSSLAYISRSTHPGHQKQSSHSQNSPRMVCQVPESTDRGETRAFILPRTRRRRPQSPPLSLFPFLSSPQPYPTIRGQRSINISQNERKINKTKQQKGREKGIKRKMQEGESRNERL